MKLEETIHMLLKRPLAESMPKSATASHDSTPSRVLPAVITVEDGSFFEISLKIIKEVKKASLKKEPCWKTCPYRIQRQRQDHT